MRGRFNLLSVRRLPAPFRLAIASVATLLAFLVEFAFLPRPDVAPFVFFYVSVVIASLLGGHVAGFLAVVLAAVIANYAFIQPANAWVYTSASIAATILFLVAASVVVILSTALSDSLLRSQQNADLLREKEQRLRAMFDNAALGIAEIDVEGRLTVVNDRLCSILGYRRDELVGMSFYELTAPEDRHYAQELRGKLAGRHLDLFDLEKRYLRHDGAPLWVHVTVSAVRDGSGKLLSRIATVEDISERKRSDDRLRESEAKLRAVFRSLTEGVIFFNTRGEVEEANEAVLRHSNDLGALSVLERQMRQRLIRPDGSPFPAEELPPMLALHRGEAVRDVEVGIPRNGGAVTWQLVNAQPVRDANGNLLGAVASFFDITDRKCAEEALKKANERLEEADRRKNEFLAVLSHELRNPLAPIRNSLHILDRAPAGSEQARRAKAVIDRQVNHMARLVTDLLDVSRISRGKVELQRQRIDLRDIVLRTVEDHRSVFTARNIQPRCEIPAGPVWVNGDATRLAQALGNLLHNSAKFTNAGGTVSVRLTQEGQTAALRVKDSGIGIEPEMLDHIFEPFTQADRTLDRSAGGLGLGLALVKGLVELHGGEVSVRSEGTDKGAEFTLRIPTVADPAPQARPERRLVRSKSLRVLVIEDNVDAAETLKEVLEIDAHEVAVAFSGPEGLTKARAFAPNVVLCDIGLPGMTGYEVARAIRADRDLHATALVALTGYALAEDQKKAADAGFDWHLAKPPDLHALERILAELSLRSAA